MLVLLINQERLFVIQQPETSRSIIYRICSETSIQTPTLLHLQAPYFARFEGDKIIETEVSDQPIAGAAFFALCSEKNLISNKEPTVILLLGQTDLLKIYEVIQEVPQREFKRRPPLILGIQENAREEVSSLRQKSRSIITSPERLIDHIRLNNISLRSVKQLILLIPQESELNRFERDTLFIDTKLPKTRDITIFCQNGIVPTMIQDILKAPKMITRKEWRYCQAIYSHYITHDIVRMMMEFVYASSYGNGVVLTSSDKKEQLKNTLQAAGMGTSRGIADTFLITDHPEQLLLNKHIEFLIVTDFQSGNDFDHLIEILTNCRDLQEVLFLLPPEQQHQFTQWKEKQRMSTEEKTRPSQEDIIAGKIRDMVVELRSNSDPETLKLYHRLIKKNTSFFDRSHLLAFLMANSIDKKGNSRSQGGRNQERREIVPRENMQTIFVGGGKKRGIFTGNIVKFFMEQGGIDKDEIGKIRVLPNYSFVEVPADKADQLVAKLDNTKLNGRPVRVNIAQSKEQ